jgi:hypothetical protein
MNFAAVRISALVAISALALGAARAESPAVDHAGAVRELRNQDEAFSLVLEAYHEVQASLIESGYEARLREASESQNDGTRRVLRDLADLERDLRSDALSRKLEHLRAAYEYGRRDDEREGGIHVPMVVDTTAAASKLTDFHPIVVADVGQPVFCDHREIISSTPPAARISSQGAGEADVPAQFRNPVSLLRRVFPEDEPVFRTVAAEVSHRSQPPNDSFGSKPILVVAAYRQVGSSVTDVVVEVFNTLDNAPDEPVSNGHRGLRLEGGELFTPFENWVRLICAPSVTRLGPDAQSDPLKRAFDQMLKGDPTLLCEQTVEPLQVMAVLTTPESLLPGSIRSRVRAVAVKAELTSDRWRCDARLISSSPEAAAATAATLASWREMARSVVDVYGGGDTRRTVRQALDDSRIETSGDTVIVRGTAPGNLSIRGICKLLRLATDGRL